MVANAGFDRNKLIGFVATSNADAARRFYRDVLGLRLVAEDPFALVFDANGTMLRVAIVPEVRPAPYTALGWAVDDAVATVHRLHDAGVQLERYPRMDHDENGVWTSPAGARVAWFKDPDGNTLSITQF